ncbi:MAG: hypothetical protein QM756_11080 [Polyangiaceae bacterium]
MIRVSIKFKGLAEALRDLKRLRQQAVPYAMRSAANTMAFEAQKEWRSVAKQKLTTRNPFTTRSMRVEMAKGNMMRAVVGSDAPYMGQLEVGSTRQGKAGHKAIPTAAAAGQALGAKRTRMVSARYRLASIQVPPTASKATRQQRNAIALAVARKKAQKVALLERARGGKALFAIGGGKRKLTTRMLWNFSRHSVRVPAHATLEPAMRAVGQRAERIGPRCRREAAQAAQDTGLVSDDDPRGQHEPKRVSVAHRASNRVWERILCTRKLFRVLPASRILTPVGCDTAGLADNRPSDRKLTCPPDPS